MKKILLLTITLATLLSCNEEESPPAFLNIDNVQFLDNPGAPANQGTLRQEIEAINLTIRDVDAGGASDDLGVLNIPSVSPYLGSGNKVIFANALVPINGSLLNLDIHPHIERLEIENYQIDPLETYDLPLNFQYKNNDEIIFFLNEEFESNNQQFTDYELDEFEGLLQLSTVSPFEGNQSARIVLDEDNPTISVATDGFFPLTIQGRPMLELHANTEVDLLISVLDNSGELNLMAGISPTDGQWKKFYFDLTENIGFLNNAGRDFFKLHFSALNLEPNPVTIQIDNVKLVQAK